MGKGESAGDQNFLLFPQCFLPTRKRISVFKLHLFCRLQMLYSGVISPLTSAEACEKSSRWLWKEKLC